MFATNKISEPSSQAFDFYDSLLLINTWVYSV